MDQTNENQLLELKKYAESQDMNTRYPMDQIKGLLMEMGKDTSIHRSYIDEKCDNIKRYFDRL